MPYNVEVGVFRQQGLTRRHVLDSVNYDGHCGWPWTRSFIKTFLELEPAREFQHWYNTGIEHEYPDAVPWAMPPVYISEFDIIRTQHAQTNTNDDGSWVAHEV